MLGKKAPYFYIFLVIFCVTTNLVLDAQTTLFNQGQVVHINSGGSVFVQGDAVIDGATAQMTNLGRFETKNSTNQGDFTIQNNAIVNGSGDFLVEGNWINNAVFTANASNPSKVMLTGANQLITGSETTSFYDLELENTSSIKTMTLPCTIQDSLILNSNELATQNFIARFTNFDSGAITYNTTYGNEGYISSDLGGGLTRLMQNSSDYLFPVGSSQGVERFRPVLLQGTTSPDSFTVAMHNYNAGNDGYYTDSILPDLCVVNPLFYHNIIHSGPSSANVSIYYDPTADAYSFSQIAQWNTPQSMYWNELPNSVLQPPSGNYQAIQSLGWSDFSQTPFILGAQGVSGPTIIPPSFFCKGLDSVLLVASGSQAPYTWVVPSGVEILSGQGSDSLYVNWGWTNGLVQVQGNTSGICPTQASTLIIPFTSNVLAAFSVDTQVVYADQSVVFEDQSTGSVDQWSWMFNAPYTSNAQNPTHIFTQPGIYQVQLLVTDSIGCQDTSSLRIEVLEYIKFPNVFSPNADGVNDFFTIPFVVNEGLYSLEIYNRWGQLLFVSDDTKLSWDGRNQNGQALSSGTYYYVFKGSSSSKKYNQTGFVTLTR